MPKKIRFFILISLLIFTYSTINVGAEENNSPPKSGELLPSQHNENPTPRLKSNRDTPESKLKPIKDLEDMSKEPKGAKLIKIEKKLLGDYEIVSGVRNHDIDSNRQIYVRTTSYPMLDDPNIGRIKNAIQTVLIDAESGEFIGYEVKGDEYLDIQNIRQNPTLDQVRNGRLRVAEERCKLGDQDGCNEFKQLQQKP